MKRNPNDVFVFIFFLPGLLVKFTNLSMLIFHHQRQMQKGMSARTFLFSPGGPLAKELSRHGVVLKVNDWLFAHGGVHPHHGEHFALLFKCMFYFILMKR